MLENCHITDYSPYRRISSAVVCVGIALIGLLQGCQSNAKLQSHRPVESASSRTGSPVSAPGLGERFGLGEVEVTVNTAEDSRLASGEDYVVVRWTYTNLSSQPLNDKPSIHLIAPNGKRYSADTGATFSLAAVTYRNEMILGEMGPGVKNDDADVFEVGRLDFDPATWRIVIDMSGREMPVSFGSSPVRSAATRSRAPTPTRS